MGGEIKYRSVGEWEGRYKARKGEDIRVAWRRGSRNSVSLISQEWDLVVLRTPQRGKDPAGKEGTGMSGFTTDNRHRIMSTSQL